MRITGWLQRRGSPTTAPLAGLVLAASAAMVASAHAGPGASALIHACLGGGRARTCRDNVEAFVWLLAGAPGL
jgi:hypothetical protein